MEHSKNIKKRPKNEVQIRVFWDPKIGSMQKVSKIMPFMINSIITKNIKSTVIVLNKNKSF